MTVYEPLCITDSDDCTMFTADKIFFSMAHSNDDSATFA